MWGVSFSIGLKFNSNSLEFEVNSNWIWTETQLKLNSNSSGVHLSFNWVSIEFQFKFNWSSFECKRIWIEFQFRHSTGLEFEFLSKSIEFLRKSAPEAPSGGPRGQRPLASRHLPVPLAPAAFFLDFRDLGYFCLNCVRISALRLFPKLRIWLFAFIFRTEFNFELI